MNPHLSASLQGVHNVIQTGIHRFHFKDGAFEDKITQKQEPRDPSEIISTLELLIASSLTSISEKTEFRKMVDMMGMMGQMHDITTWYSEEEAKTFNIATDSLMVAFVEDHRKRSIEQRLADFRTMYDEKYGPESSQVMLFEVDDGVMGYCKGNKTGLVPPMAGSEADEAVKAAWFAELAGGDNAAPATPEKKKKSRQELRKTKRDAEKEAKRSRNGA
ncbi:hypothetical protein GJ744_006903 [Endocarpon pusillum]|uniref:Uncharacterized protein n=1 Tax=Endocarpon pusillum TaxID=364733 RepID=A0A8H7E5M1_9EURO|nr:hypothetical protein GJ744_006903 [Endocarpon pusillum]